MKTAELKQILELADRLQLPADRLTICNQAGLMQKFGCKSLEAAYILAEFQGCVFQVGNYYVYNRS